MRRSAPQKGRGVTLAFDPIEHPAGHRAMTLNCSRGDVDASRPAKSQAAGDPITAEPKRCSFVLNVRSVGRVFTSSGRHRPGSNPCSIA